MGPFEPCPRNPILTNRSLPKAVKAVGHSDLIQAADGSWLTVCLGIRPVSYPERHHLGRETFLAPVKWDKDGWPVMGNNGTIDLDMEAEGLPIVKWEEKSTRDDFDSLNLNNSWNFLRNPYEKDWSLYERSGSITLKGSCVTLEDVDSPAFIGRRQEHFNVEISTILDFEPLENSEEAGLTVYLNNKHHYDIAITRLENKKCIILRRRIGSLWKVENCILCDEGSIILGVKATPSKYVFTFKEKDKATVKIGEDESCYLSTEVGGAFTGVYIGIYATGNGKQSTSTAYFDWFDYIPAKDQRI